MNEFTNTRAAHHCRLRIPKSVKDIQVLMTMMERMPVNPFLEKNKAYKSVGCDPKASPYIYSSL